MRWFPSIRHRNILLAILGVAAALRLWNLGGADMVNDEVYYALRGIGYLDYIGSTRQSTPLFWFDTLPAWTRLSFHDHPPLVFMAARAFFSVFGVSPLVARLPFAISGIGSVLLMYLIARKMFSERVGLIAAGVMAISSNAVFASRSALMEPLALLLILLSWYVFLLALENIKYWPWWGVALGASWLAKYTAFPALAAALAHLAIFRRNVFKIKQFYVGLLAAALLVSPVIIYNVMLYRTRGNFDLQFAALLKQDVPAWQTLAEKIPSSYWQNFMGIGTGLVDAYSPVALALAAAGAIFSIWLIVKHKNASHVLLTLFVVFYTLLLVLIKPLPRFLAYYELAFPLLVGAVVAAAWERYHGLPRRMFGAAAVLVLVYELGFSVNTSLLPASLGPANLAWSLARPYTADFGINKLDRYLTKELAGKATAGVPQSGIPALDAVIQKNATNHGRGKTPEKILLVYNTRLHETVTLWNFDRRYLYEGWPALYVDELARLIGQDQGKMLQGYTLYYVTGTKYSLWRNVGGASLAAVQLEHRLAGQGRQPDVITNQFGLPVFKIYRFRL